ncbi:L-seryl-tRNA(Sec) selenium transferase [Luteimonas sp. MC1750]|nr:L-seryl-tRNA(Sec) selenium transferase [Luteimonas sp. MC1750]MBJ6984417.1 L-seryl-tRNA(Sec) selenium transferase [Luteimonas sp. MC1750]QQO07272.1 L-seryl-tRNA(Sec) selenium transferase [Luteimonas sp. MC1750]
MTVTVPDDDAAAGASDIPSLDRLLKDPAIAALATAHGLAGVTSALRARLQALRDEARAGTLRHAALAPATLAEDLGATLERAARPRLRAVYNLTGTVLHTNLGRAVLPDVAVQSVVQALSSPMALEYDLERGARGDRDDLVEALLCELTGAEAATVVNNNAAAVLLMLNSLANRREVVVSRGELVEIGGAFRVPDIMSRAGAKLVEVGTTNRTHPGDYAGAIGPRTAMLMKVHCSNYAITGFTSSVDTPALAEIAHARGLPVGVDLGSGSLVDPARWGLPHGPTVRETLEAGADLVTFSGDKLLGGPQAGLIVGSADLVGKIRRNPLKRALRVGKLTLAALEPVLALYRAPEHLPERLTTLRLLLRRPAAMHAQALRLVAPLQAALGPAWMVGDAAMASQIGSGAMPVEALPSHGLVLRPAAARGRGRALAGLGQSLRGLPRPVIGRIADDALWLDLRCLEESDEAAFAAQLAALRA